MRLCLQCGVCTASCDIVQSDRVVIPRAQMSLVQSGQLDRLYSNPGFWHCYDCGDCSTKCPSGALPKQLMSAGRQMAVECFSSSSVIARVFYDPVHSYLLLLVPSLLLLAAIALGGSFAPSSDPVRFASMLPHGTVNVFFGAFTALAVILMARSALRAWTEWQGDSVFSAEPRRLTAALLRGIAEVASHRKFADCDAHAMRRWAHVGVFYGFMTLLAIAGIVAAMIVVGLPYPLPAIHPLKIVGNLAGISMIAGCLYFLHARWHARRQGEPSSWFDWVFLVDVLATCVTGLAAEVLRYRALAGLAYPVYFLHLVCVFVLLASLPCSKLAHAVLRIVAVASRMYAEQPHGRARDLDAAQAKAA